MQFSINVLKNKTAKQVREKRKRRDKVSEEEVNLSFET